MPARSPLSLPSSGSFIPAPRDALLHPETNGSKDRSELPVAPLNRSVALHDIMYEGLKHSSASAAARRGVPLEAIAEASGAFRHYLHWQITLSAPSCEMVATGPGTTSGPIPLGDSALIAAAALIHAG